MADNTIINATTAAGGVTFRDVDKAGLKTQVVTLDLGGAGAEAKRHYSPDTNELSPQKIPSLVSVMIQRQIQSRRNSAEIRRLVMYNVRARAALLAA